MDIRSLKPGRQIAIGMLKIVAALVLLLAFSTQGGYAGPVADKRPYVLVVYADWCPSCQQLKPTLAFLNEKYRDRIRFLRFDITTEQSAARSKELASKMGLADFYDKNHERTSVVIILDSSRHEVFRTVNDFAPDHYVAALDQQLSAEQK
jgi:thiol-disulfide isomerase/thioredoxin